MNNATTLAKQSTGEAQRLSPLEAFVAWLANFLRTITGMKRRKVIPTNWKDHWPGLREIECYRDQILAFSASHVLSGGSLNERTNFQLIMEVPDTYGICPRTLQAMNRRFIAMAQFRMDSSKYIHRHIRRIAKREGIALTSALRIDPLRHATKTSRAASPGFAGGRTTRLASLGRLATREHGLSRRSATKEEGGLAFITRARGPPSPHFDCRLLDTSAHSRA